MKNAIKDIVARTKQQKKYCINKMGAEGLNENSPWFNIISDNKFDIRDIIVLNETMPDYSFKERLVFETLPCYKELKKIIVDKALTRALWDMKDSKMLFNIRQGPSNYTPAYFVYNKDKDVLKACIVHPEVAGLFQTDLLYAIDYNVGTLVAAISFVTEIPKELCI